MPVIVGGNSGAGGVPANEYMNGKPIFAGNIRYVPRYWDDLRIPASSVQGQGADDPSFLLFQDNGAGSEGVFAWQYSNVINQDLFFWVQIPHSWQQGGTIKPHIHWAPMTGGAGNVFWRLEYTFANIGSAFPLTILDSVAAAASGTPLQHQVANFLDIPMPGGLISRMVGARIIRGAVNPADTYGALAALLEVDFHYELDTPGSRQPTVK